MEVAAADVSVDDEVVGLAGDGGVIQLKQLFFDCLKTLFVGAEIHAGHRVNEHTPAAIVKLEVAAASGIDVGDELLVARGDVFGELAVVRVILSGVLQREGHYHLLDELCGGGNGELCNGVLILKRLDELEVLHEWMGVERDLAGEVGVVEHRGLAVEGKSGLGGTVADAVEAPHKVEVPCRAAELAVGDDVVARGFLLGDEIAYCLVLDGLERFGVYRAVLEICARLLERRGAEKAADIIISEGCIHILLLLSVFAMIIRPSARQVNYAFRRCYGVTAKSKSPTLCVGLDHCVYRCWSRSILS